MFAILLHFCLTDFLTGLSIWEIGTRSGKVPAVDIGSISPESFFKRYHIAPFVVRGFHKTLDEIAEHAGYKGDDSLDWLRTTIGDRETISTIEGELHETRKAPTLNHIKWKYFFEAFREVDMYAVSQAPRPIRQYLQYFPYYRCGGLRSAMRPPFMWLSGGLKGSRSVVHADSYHNQHCVLKGKKRFMLIPSFVELETPEFGWVQVDAEAAGNGGAYGEYVADLDPENVDLERMPGWKDVPWLYAELQAGDCIYMPKEWYHYVESDAEPTLTWHVWFKLPEEWDESDVCPANPEWFPASACRFREDVWEKKDFWESQPEQLKSICDYL